MIVAQTWPLSRKLPGFTICSINPEKGALTCVLFTSTTPKLHRTVSFATNFPWLAPIATTSPDVFAFTSTLASDFVVAFNFIKG